MSSVGIFGEVVSGYHVESAVVETLRTWQIAYLNEFARRENEDLPVPKTISVFSELDQFVGTQLPAVVVASPGVSEEAVRDGIGGYRATWDIGVGTIVVAKSHSDSHRLVRQYASVWRTLLVQQANLGSFSRGTDWIGESYDIVEADEAPTLEISMVSFQVEVEGVAVSGEGPRTQEEVDYYSNLPGDPSWPIADTIEIRESIERS